MNSVAQVVTFLCYLNQTDSPGKNSGTETLQRGLNDCYQGGLNPDGVYGALTAAAVKKAQRQAGLTEDGMYGPDTATHQEWYHTFHGCIVVPSIF
jgi:peptidoglycan hydrolase-like protein with peptidoglycan-binding domain